MSERDAMVAEIERLRSQVKRVSDAWRVEGPNPGYHKHHQAKLRREWPTLATALDALSHPDDR
jgi:hypothetical protein